MTLEYIRKRFDLTPEELANVLDAFIEDKNLQTDLILYINSSAFSDEPPLDYCACNHLV